MSKLVTVFYLNKFGDIAPWELLIDNGIDAQALRKSAVFVLLQLLSLAKVETWIRMMMEHTLVRRLE